MNDSPQYICLNEENAKKKLKQLKSEYYYDNRWNFKDIDDYEVRCNWHIKEVEGD